MSIVLSIIAFVRVALRRLWSQQALTFGIFLGLVASIALTMSIPLYADAVYNRVLGEKITPDPQAVQRPPFAFLFRYDGAWAGTVQWADIEQVDTYLSRQAGPALGLPTKWIVRQFETDTFRVFPQKEIAYADVKQPLLWIQFGFLSDFEKHITLLEGRLPAAAEPVEDSTVEVLVSEEVAQKVGFQIGEEYVTFHRSDTNGALRTVQIPVRVAGIWRATDPAEEYWLYQPSLFEDTFLVPEATFVRRLSPHLDDEIYNGSWYLMMDGSNLHASEVNALLGRIGSVWQHGASLRPNLSLVVSPAENLEQYRRSAEYLTVLLYALSIPLLGLMLVFIGLVVGLSVSTQRNEIAVLRSRGATMLQVIGIAALEAMLLGGLALVVSAPASVAIAQLIGTARSFLNFGVAPGLRVGVTPDALRFGVVAVGLALLAQVAPTIAAARHTIVSYKQERARSIEPPWWQRAWFDLLLLIPALYGLYLLRMQGSIVAPAVGTTLGGESLADPFQNPLLFLVPALGIFAFALFILRLLPPAMNTFAWIASQTGSVGVLLACRYLARTPSLYAAPLLLLILTLSLSTFTASFAKTFDKHLYDQMRYKVGADLALQEFSDVPAQASSAPSSNAGSMLAPPSESGLHYVFLPVSEHLRVPGVQGAARVGRFPASTQLTGATQQGTFIGIDRIDFPKTAFWRKDFAPVSLGTLMNQLALAPDGALVTREFMAQHALNYGDTVRVTVTTEEKQNPLDLRIVGAFDLFPTWYPGEETLFVGNLDYLFEQAGAEFPYDVWLKTDTETNPAKIVQGVRDLHLRVLDWEAALLQVYREQARPERQGLFGLLSVGFAAAAVLTVLGFSLYALFSFRRRFVELGILRAVGLSSLELTAFLAAELAFLLLIGLVAGTLLGVMVSQLLIPYLQVGAGVAARTPSFIPQIAWDAVFQMYAIFGLLFVVALAAMTQLLLRMRIFEAIKLGETV